MAHQKIIGESKQNNMGAAGSSTTTTTTTSTPDTQPTTTTRDTNLIAPLQVEIVHIDRGTDQESSAGMIFLHYSFQLLEIVAEKKLQRAMKRATDEKRNV